MFQIRKYTFIHQILRALICLFNYAVTNTTMNVLVLLFLLLKKYEMFKI